MSGHTPREVTIWFAGGQTLSATMCSTSSTRQSSNLECWHRRLCSFPMSEADHSALPSYLKVPRCVSTCWLTLDPQVPCFRPVKKVRISHKQAKGNRVKWSTPYLHNFAIPEHVAGDSGIRTGAGDEVASRHARWESRCGCASLGGEQRAGTLLVRNEMVLRVVLCNINIYIFWIVWKDSSCIFTQLLWSITCFLLALEIMLLVQHA